VWREPRDPHAERRKPGTICREDARRRTVGDDTRAGPDHDDAIDETQRRFDVMLDEQHRSSAVCYQRTQDVVYKSSAFFIEIGFWFVEQEKSWLERDRSGDR
jgi:hypothetical protein